MQWGGDFGGSAREKFDAVFDVGCAARVGEFFDRNGSLGVNAALSDPVLESV